VITSLLGLVIVSHLSPKDRDASMVRARFTRDSRQFCTGSGRFETRNTLRPGVDLLCGGLQRNSLARGMLES
jgi:hypothetical protein